MAEDVFAAYRKKLKKRHKRKKRPSNNHIQKQKQLFASGDKFSRIFEECEREIRYIIRNTSATTCHFSLRVQRLLVLLDSQYDTDLEQKLHFIVRDHVVSYLADDSSIGICLKKFANLFHATFALSLKQLKHTSAINELSDTLNVYSAMPSPCASGPGSISESFFKTIGVTLGLNSPAASVASSSGYSNISSSIFSNRIQKEHELNKRKHKGAVTDVQKAIDRLISLVVLRYPQLRESKLFYVAEQAVHSVIFPALEPTLVDLYRLCVKDAEFVFTSNCNKMIHLPLTAFGLDEKFILSTESMSPQTPDTDHPLFQRRGSVLTEIIAPHTAGVRLMSQDLSGFEDYSYSITPQFGPAKHRGSIPHSNERRNFLEEDAEITSDSSSRISPSNSLAETIPRISTAGEEQIQFYVEEIEPSDSRDSIKSSLTASLHKKGNEHGLKITTDKDRIAERLTNSCRQAYRPAFELISQIESKTTPYEKLIVVKNIAGTLCDCVDRTYEGILNESEKIRIGTDELIVLFAYMMIQSQNPSVLTDLEFVEDFISTRGTNTLESYYLSTIRAAAKLLASQSCIRCLIVTGEVEDSFDSSNKYMIRQSF